MREDGGGTATVAVDARGHAARPPGVPEAVWVVSPHTLVAQTVAAALASTGLSVEFHAWEHFQGCQSNGSDGPGVRHLLAIFDGVAPPETMKEISRLVSGGGARVAVVTSAPDALSWGGLLQGSAVDVVTMTSSVSQLAEVVRRFIAGDSLMEPARRHTLRVAWLEALDKRHHLVCVIRTLSPRQLHVLNLLAVGRCVAEVAEDIGVTDATVRSHVKTLRAKLGARTQLEAVAMLRHVHDVDGPTELVPRLRQPLARATRAAQSR